MFVVVESFLLFKDVRAATKQCNHIKTQVVKWLYESKQMDFGERPYVLPQPAQFAH